MFIPSADRSALLGCIKEVGYNCAFASLMRANDARRKRKKRGGFEKQLYRSMINFGVIAHYINITGNDESPQEL